MSAQKWMPALLAMLVMSPTAHAQTASVKADFQPVRDGTIIVTEVVLRQDGFLVVRLPKDNKVFYGDVLAAVPLKAGTHKNLQVRLDRPAKAGDTLGLVLHKDDATLGTYEFEIGKEADEPFFEGRRPIL
ncbi:MAG: hypothetical protein AAGL24_13880 [Pseudomonadota bacterium]